MPHTEFRSTLGAKSSISRFSYILANTVFFLQTNKKSPFASRFIMSTHLIRIFLKVKSFEIHTLMKFASASSYNTQNMFSSKIPPLFSLGCSNKTLIVTLMCKMKKPFSKPDRKAYPSTTLSVTCPCRPNKL